MPVSDALDDSSVQPAHADLLDLYCAVDDEDDPTQVTIYSERDGELPTHWISMDVEHAVALDEMV